MVINRKQLVPRLHQEFPEISADLNDEMWAGLLHLEVACFTQYTQEQIDSEDEPKLVRCFEVASEFLLNGDANVKNAMYVSYLEHLNFQDGKRKRQWAKEHMSPAFGSGL